MTNNDGEKIGGMEIVAKDENIKKLEGSMLETLVNIEEEKESEFDLDLELVDYVLEYLELQKVEFEIENVGVLPYKEVEVENREIVFENDFLAVTLDDTDEETGEKTHGVWIKR